MTDLNHNSNVPITEQKSPIFIEDQKIISLNKFLVLSFITFGLYQVWWTFKVWKFFIQKDGINIMPAFRALFSIFFNYALFKRIQTYAKSEGYTRNYSSGLLFLGFFIFSLISILPNSYQLLSIFYIVFMIPAFQALNFAKRNSNQFKVIEQEKWSTPQIIVIIIFSILWLLFFLGLYSIYTGQLQ